MISLPAIDMAACQIYCRQRLRQEFFNDKRSNKAINASYELTGFDRLYATILVEKGLDA